MDRKSGEKYNPIFRASQNRINLIKEASGEYITFLDGDDFYTDNNKFQTQVDILDSINNKDCIACSHDVDFFYENTGKSKHFINNVTNKYKINIVEYWSKYYFPASSFMFRNIFNKKFPNEINKNFFDDNLITFYFLKFGSIYYINKTMSCYTQQDQSIWSQKNATEREIINLMDCDIELQVAPEFKDISLVRHFNNYKFLYKNKISDDLIEKYKPDAIKYGCTLTYEMLNYKNFIFKIINLIKYNYFNYKVKRFKNKYLK